MHDPPDAGAVNPIPEVARVIEAADAYRGDQPPDALIAALNGLVSPDQQLLEGAYPVLSEGLKRIKSPRGQGFVAVWLGAGVENGADPHVPLLHVLPAFFALIASIDTSEEKDADEDSFTETDDDVLAGLQYLGQALVAMLTRCPEEIQRLSEKETALTELERVEHLSPGPEWVLGLLRQRSGELLVMHGIEAVAVRVRYQNIANCFHLFTLLQGVMPRVMPGSKLQSDMVRRTARGEVAGNVEDTAWWHFGQGNVPEPELGGMVFGEQTPDSIEEIDGQQVLLLWPPILMERSWNSGFFGPRIEARPPSVEVLEKLPPDQVETWRLRLNLPPAKRRSWWRLRP